MSRAKKTEAETSAPMPKMWSLSKIKPYPNNPRTHPDEQIELLASLMKKHGIDQPIVVDENGVIIKGHGRRLAAIEAGFKDYPVIQHTGLSEDDKRAIRISDNSVALLSGWDTSLLRSEVHDLSLAGYDMPMLGFTDKQIASYLPTPEKPRNPDEVVDPPEKPIIQFGDMWNLEDHRILCGDSTSKESWDRLMDEEKGSMVFTDPPYGVSYEAASGDFDVIQGDRKRQDDLYQMLVRITARAGGYFRCNQCKEDFTVRTGTIFERSHVPLHKWIYATYLLVTARKGISSLQLAKEIGITQKSAWFVLHRLREACGDDLTKLQGIVEIDETYVGGIEKNKHESKKLKAGRGTVGKTAVVAMRERKGRMKAMAVEDADMATLHTKIHQHVAAGSTLHTDEAGVYRGLGGLFFNHETVNHSEGEYVRDGVTTNGVESVFAVMKRGLIGVYHHASKKHLGRYVDEFAFRLNDGNVKRHTMERLESFVSGTKGKRLTYKALIQ